MRLGEPIDPRITPVPRQPQFIPGENPEDFVVDTVWTWNEFDKVSVKIDPKKIKLKAKADLSKYEI